MNTELQVGVECANIRFCSKKKLHILAEHLKLVPPQNSIPEGVSFDKKFLLELLVSMHFERNQHWTYFTFSGWVLVGVKWVRMGTK